MVMLGPENPINSSIVLDALVRMANQSPKRVAVACGDNELSYGSLYEAAYCYAKGLRELGVAPQSMVALQVERTIELLPVLLGVWLAGCGYVPVDPAYPADRRRHIIEDSGATLLIVDDPEILNDEYGCASLALAPNLKENTGAAIEPHTWQAFEIAYLIYTSGSTGLPKGVAVTCANVNNFLSSMAHEPGLGAQDTLLAVTTISFDIHVLELFLPIVAGANVVITSNEEARSQESLARLIDYHKVTALQATPATWRMLGQQGWLPERKMTQALVGGEALPSDLLPTLHAMAADVWNMYGPTETTVWSTCARLRFENPVITIGKAISNTQLHVVDAANKPVEQGQEGELLIGGLGVSAGYHNRPELNDENFVTLPGLSPGRLYRTGDLVVELPSGDLKYISRIDNQIKIRGFRVEPGEIESVIAETPGIDHCAVVLCEFGPADMRLVACINNTVIDDAHLRKLCAARLPAQMRPHHFVSVKTFPVTNNNKLDRKALTLEARTLCKADADLTLPISGAPRDDRDLSLVAVWEQALGVTGVGIDSDFFALGGHSLLVLQVIEGMNRAADLDVTAADIFKCKTIRTLLAGLGREKQAASVVPLNNIDTKRSAIFCLSGVSIYSEFAGGCNDWSVFGVFSEQEVALLDAAALDYAASASLSQLVDAYVAAILRQGEFDEVVLLGLSFGGMLAVEVARALLDRGIAVQKIIFLDSYLDTSARRTWGQSCCDALAHVQENGVKRASGALMRRIASKLSRLSNNASKVQVSNDTQTGENLRTQVYSHLALAYQTGLAAFQAEYLLVKADKTDFGWGMVTDHDYGWGRVLGDGLSVVSVDADHIGMMSGAAAEQVAIHVNNFLND